MFERKPRILIADNTPLSVLSLLGPEGLDWLFVPGADVWVTDMVKEEAVRAPDPGATSELASAIFSQGGSRTTPIVSMSNRP